MRVVKRKSREMEIDSRISFLDINQLELAFINKVLRTRRKLRLPEFVEIGKNKRILLIQKQNLERLCRKIGRKVPEGELEEELDRILSGNKIFSFFPRI